MVLAHRIPERIRRIALKPDQNDLGDVEDNIQNGDGNQTAADFGV